MVIMVFIMLRTLYFKLIHFTFQMINNNKKKLTIHVFSNSIPSLVFNVAFDHICILTFTLK